jgi:hypothetical protein
MFRDRERLADLSTPSRTGTVNGGGWPTRSERGPMDALPLQPGLALPRALPAHARRRPAQAPEGYRLPHDIRDRLVAALAPYRNRDAAFMLEAFLGRFWSMPGRVALPFVIDRVALADRPDLGLSEARIRGAIKTLEAIAFLARWPTTGSAYRATEDGLRRKPVGFTFGSDYMPAFIAANNRAVAARGRQEGARRIRHRTPPEARPWPHQRLVRLSRQNTRAKRIPGSIQAR